MYVSIGLLYENIDQIRPSKLHGPMQYNNRCYKCIQWPRVLYSVVITWQSNPPISRFNCPCNEITSVWSVFVYNTRFRLICLCIFDVLLFTGKVPHPLHWQVLLLQSKCIHGLCPLWAPATICVEIDFVMLCVSQSRQRVGIRNSKIQKYL